MDILKRCSKCLEEKPIASYGPDKRAGDGRQSRCRKCHAAASKAWADANREFIKAKNWSKSYVERNPDKVKASKDRYNQSEYGKAMNRLRHLRRKYGITPSDFDSMYTAQKGSCAICEKPLKKFQLVIDHCHDTGKVRGLLCHRCNIGLGYIDQGFVTRGLGYVEATG